MSVKSADTRDKSARTVGSWQAERAAARRLPRVPRQADLAGRLLREDVRVGVGPMVFKL